MPHVKVGINDQFYKDLRATFKAVKKTQFPEWTWNVFLVNCLALGRDHHVEGLEFEAELEREKSEGQTLD